MTKLEAVAREPLGFVALVLYFWMSYQLFELIGVTSFSLLRSRGVPYALAVLIGILCALVVHFVIHIIKPVRLA